MALFHLLIAGHTRFVTALKRLGNAYLVNYPEQLAAGTQYSKYGPTPSIAAATRYILPSNVAGSTVTFTMTDGGRGDDVLSANRTIVDQGGQAVQPVAIAAPPVTVPALHPPMIAQLALLLALRGVYRSASAAALSRLQGRPDHEIK